MKQVALLVGLLIFNLSAAAQGLTAEKPHEFETQLQMWVRANYPAIVEEPRVPSELLLGFLVDSRNNVLKHSVAIQRPDPKGVADELKRMFPERDHSELVRTGSMCFLKPDTTQRWYCVIYAELRK